MCSLFFVRQQGNTLSSPESHFTFENHSPYSSCPFSPHHCQPRRCSETHLHIEDSPTISERGHSSQMISLLRHDILTHGIQAAAGSSHTGLRPTLMVSSELIKPHFPHHSGCKATVSLPHSSPSSLPPALSVQPWQMYLPKSLLSLCQLLTHQPSRAPHC